MARRWNRALNEPKTKEQRHAAHRFVPQIPHETVPARHIAPAQGVDHGYGGAWRARFGVLHVLVGTVRYIISLSKTRDMAHATSDDRNDASKWGGVSGDIRGGAHAIFTSIFSWFAFGRAQTQGPGPQETPTSSSSHRFWLFTRIPGACLDATIAEDTVAWLDTRVKQLGATIIDLKVELPAPQRQQRRGFWLGAPKFYLSSP